MSATIRTARVSGQVTTTGGHLRGEILWIDEAIDCCDGQAGWPEGRVPDVWDPTGVGHWEMASYVQCGGCGSLLRPAWGVVDADDYAGYLRARADLEADLRSREVPR